MNLCRYRSGFFAGIFVLVSLTHTSAFAATTRWTNSASGFWRDGVNWISNAVPSSTYSTVLITNQTTKTVTIDAATAAANLTVATLTISAPTGSTNTMRLVDLTTNVALDVTGTLTVNRLGAIVITNSALQVDSSFNLIAGSVVMDSGLINCPNITVTVGRTNTSTGTLTLNGGTMQTRQLNVGSGSGGASAVGVCNISGGTLIASSLIEVGYAGNLTGSTGTLAVTSGQLIATNTINDVTRVGDGIRGKMTISGGAATCAGLSIGYNTKGTLNITGGQLTCYPGAIRASTTNALEISGGDTGEFTMSGGIVQLFSEFHIGNSLSATGTVSITGGQLTCTNDTLAVGRYGIGLMTVSNATIMTTNVSVGRHDGAVGTFTLQSNSVFRSSADFSIGRFSNSVGHVFIAGGQLIITNDSIWVGREGIGDLSVSNGTVQTESLYVGKAESPTNSPPQGTAYFAGGNTFVTSNFVVGSASPLSTGQVFVVGGNLSISNNAIPGHLRIVNGSFSLNQGSVTVDSVDLTNSTGTFAFSRGTLQAKSMTVANGASFVVGDGVNPATLQLQGGVFNFANGLVISPNATLTGCGTIIGTFTNYGTIATTCAGGSNYTISGSVELQAFTGTNRMVRFVVSAESVTTTNYLQTNDVLLTFTAGSASYNIQVPTNTTPTHLSAKTAWNLRRRQAVAFPVGTAATLNFTGASNLKGGDLSTGIGTPAIEGCDNAVTSSDYLMLLGYYLQSAGGDPAISRADITGDGAVTSSDYLTTLGNYLITGDPQ